MKRSIPIAVVIALAILLMGFTWNYCNINFHNHDNATIIGNIYQDFSPRNGGRIQGPLVNANVRIYKYREGFAIYSSPLIKETTTDKKGNFKVSVEAGDYAISFFSPGDYGTELISVSQNETLFVKIVAHGVSTD